MKSKITARHKETKAPSRLKRRQEEAYGESVPICLNSGCVMRRQSKCTGYEGCPGFKGK